MMAHSMVFASSSPPFLLLRLCPVQVLCIFSAYALATFLPITIPPVRLLVDEGPGSGNFPQMTLGSDKIRPIRVSDGSRLLQFPSQSPLANQIPSWTSRVPYVICPTARCYAARQSRPRTAAISCLSWRGRREVHIVVPYCTVCM